MTFFAHVLRPGLQDYEITVAPPDGMPFTFRVSVESLRGRGMISVEDLAREEIARRAANRVLARHRHERGWPRA